MRAVLTLVVALSMFSIALGQAKKDQPGLPDDELVLREYAIKWLEADAKGDAPTVNALLADEFSFLGGKNRADYLLSMNTDTRLIVESAVVEEPRVQIYGETAIVTGINSYRLKQQDGKPVQARFPSMTVWVKRSGRWQCVKACTLPALP